MPTLDDIVVVSDLHIGKGKNLETGRYYRLEAFFYDDDFLRFCDYLIDDARLRTCTFKLVLNGDTFDLLRVDHDPDNEKSLRDKRYGPALTPKIAARVMEQIIEGHPVFIQALARVQYTFLRIRDHSAKLQQWSPGRSEIMPVVLIDGESELHERVAAN